MNIRYPIYEGVYRILTKNQQGRSPRPRRPGEAPPCPLPERPGERPLPLAVGAVGRYEQVPFHRRTAVR